MNAPQQQGTGTKLANALAKGATDRPVTAYERFRLQLNQVRGDVAGLVGKDNVDRFIRVCLNAAQANPKVLDANRRSLLLACLRAAQDRLLPDGREAVLNIYSTKVGKNPDRWEDTVQYLPMVGGLIKKLYESGHVVFVDGVAVYEKDQFEYERGDDPKIKHVPYSGDDEPGKLVAAYAIIKFKNGEVKREVMWRRDVMKVKEKSKAKTGMLWAEFEDQGWIKSVIKRAYKQVPSSPEVDRVIANDNAAEGFIDVQHTVVDISATGADLEGIVDGRVETAMRDAAGGVGSQAAPNPAQAGAGAETVTAAASTATATAPAKPAAESVAPTSGSQGTAALREKIIASIKTSTDADVLDIKRDDANFHKWGAEDLALIDAAYRDRKAELAG